MKKLIYLHLLLIIPLLFTASCKKGDIGPQGEQGLSGTDGAKGDPGDQGEKGDQGPRGTANVIYSEWVSAADFRDTTVDNSLLKAADVKAPKL
ncbi:MAG: collagen-like protein, partial [Sphingobacteriaceae bacterium]